MVFSLYYSSLKFITKGWKDQKRLLLATLFLERVINPLVRLLRTCRSSLKLLSLRKRRKFRFKGKTLPSSEMGSNLITVNASSGCIKTIKFQTLLSPIPQSSSLKRRKVFYLSRERRRL